MVHSLSLLAVHVAREPEWQGVQAFYADVPISPKRSPASVRRVSLRYGFEPVFRRRTFWRSVRGFIESMLLSGLAYAYNPVASHRQRFWRRRQRTWIGRATLIRLYGVAGRPVPAELQGQITGKMLGHTLAATIHDDRCNPDIALAPEPKK
jgi:hypothetical protein